MVGVVNLIRDLSLGWVNSWMIQIVGRLLRHKLVLVVLLWLSDLVFFSFELVWVHGRDAWGVGNERTGVVLVDEVSVLLLYNLLRVLLVLLGVVGDDLRVNRGLRLCLVRRFVVCFALNGLVRRVSEVESFSVQFADVVFQKSVISVYTLANLLHTAWVWVLVKLKFCDFRLLQCHYQLFAVPDHLVWKVSPLELWLVEHFLWVLLFLLEHH